MSGPGAGPGAGDPFAGPALDDPDDAYANAPHIPGADGYLERWPARAAAFRARTADAGRPVETLAHGPRPRERLDVFRPADGSADGSAAGAVRGVAVVVHGGYWMRFDPRTFSHLAAGALERGWLVALPGYPLCPDASIGDIEASTCRAIELAASLAPGPVRLAGHSAGGHLVTRAACADAPIAPGVAERIDRVLSISGVHDLVPLLATSMNRMLGLDPDEARARSPARSTPRPGTRAIAWVGADERPEFVRQNALLGQAWRARGAKASVHVEPGRHHFDVIEDLEREDSAMLEAWLGV